MSNLRCPKCGEEYSDTYKTCPFCQEEAAIKRGKPIRRKGKRLDKSKRSGGAGGVMLVLTLVIILGVVGYVFFGDQVAGLMGIRTEQSQDPDTGGETQQAADPAPSGDDAGETDPGTAGSDEPAGPLTLDQSAITIPAGETARINASGGAGEVTWSTSNENIATVEGGSVTGKAGGTVTITATAGEETVQCSVTVTGDPWVSDAKLSLNRTDFTLPASDPPFQLKVSGTDSAVTWASSNTNVVTVSESGVVTRVGKGTATVTASVDGHVLECIVRVP